MLSILRQKQEKVGDNYNDKDKDKDKDNTDPDSVFRQDENEILI